MTQSMTAFSRVQELTSGAQLSWEIRSVNHRFLEMSFRMPDPFRSIEMDCRQQLRQVLSRGKIECVLSLKKEGVAENGLRVNEGLVSSLLQLAQNLSTNYQLGHDLTVSQLLTFPGVIQEEEASTEAFKQLVQSLFNKTLVGFIQSRETEGSLLAEQIRSRVILLREAVQRAETIRSKVNASLRDKLLLRLNELSLAVSETRVEQEIALLLARLDVSEELDRLTIHLREVERVLASSEPVGRRLDFLMQELNRETNTLGSKSDVSELTALVVDMKVFIEQMREQIQNIE